MLIGDNAQEEATGVFGPLKNKWRNLEPGKQRKITIMVVGCLILLFATTGYLSRQHNNKNTSKNLPPKNDTKEISLNKDLIEKSLFRQTQESINKQGKLITDMRKEISQVKAAQSRQPEPTASMVTPPPSGNELSAPEDIRPAPSYSQTPAYNIPPPPVTKNEQYSDNVIGGISFVVNDHAVEKSRTEVPKKKLKIYLPPSFMEATLLSGLDAPTTSSGKSDPVPVLLRIRDLAILPNKVKANLKGCFVLGEGKGNLSSERVDVRLLTLSCVSRKGAAVIDQSVKGYVVDEDGKAGLRGIVSAKMGALLARSALAGFLSGMGDAVKSSTMDLQTTALGTQSQLWSNTDTHNMLRGGIGGGISKAGDELGKFYLQLARQTLPIIQVGATKTVTIVISEGLNLEVKDASLIK